MTSWNHRSTCATLALALAVATPAAAEITAAEVWAEWQTMIADMGGGATLEAGSETYAGGVLTLAPVTFNMDLDDGKASATLDELVMTEAADGTVAITYGGAYIVDIATDAPDDEPVEVQLSVTTPGLVINAAREGTTTTYDYTADAIGAALQSMVVDGEKIDGTMDFDMQAVAGSYALSSDGQMAFDTSYSAETASLTADFQDPDGAENRARIDAAYSGVAIASSGNMAGVAAMSDPEAILAGDVTLSSEMSHTGGQFSIDAQSEEDGPFSLAIGSTSGGFSYGFGAEGVTAAARNTGLTLAVSGAAIPLPEVTAAMDTTEFGLTMPLRPTDDPKDFGLLLTLGGLSVSEMIWSMIDPGGALSHDPATLMLALSGQMRLTAELTDEAAMNSPVPPFDFEVLTLENLRLAIAGAELTGAGGLDFSQAPEGAMPGMPGVEGAVTLNLSGANALMGTLVEMGLLPQDQAMMAQMMMGMLATPVGDDQLQSEIVLGADGSVTANGNPLR